MHYAPRFAQFFTDAWPEPIREGANRFEALLLETGTIWSQGGWAMWPIAIIAVVMFWTGMQIYVRLRAKGFQGVRESRWRRWIDRPNERRGAIGDLLHFVTGGQSIQETQSYFKQYGKSQTVPVERDLRVMKICVSAAPLVGLLGTVTGMLTTFDALANGPGGDKTMAMVASGISQALITTETGLVIALPGLFFQHVLARNFERYKAFLAHVETVCTQSLHRRSTPDDERVVREAARREIAEHLCRALAGGTESGAPVGQVAPGPT